MTIIQAEKEQLFESIEMVIRSALGKIRDDEIVELKGLIEERTYKRLKLVQDGTRIWDYAILSLQIVSGMVG